jgi:protein-L-isoaspartate(D-aspartate) O-methyltransferase
MLTIGSQDYQRERNLMVEQQIEQRGISDEQVLKAMKKVPRHMFVPSNIRHMAYFDCPLSIGSGQTISQPYIVAYMTNALELKSSDRVLEVGTGSGYQAAVLAAIVDSVFSIEIIHELTLYAEKNLNNANINNVWLKTGDGYNGWPEKAPFDAIIVTAAPSKVPQPLIDQLNNNGILIIPVGRQNQTQYLKIYEKENGRLTTRTLLPVRFVPFTRTIE